MATTAHALGPGQITIGETGSGQEFGGQVTTCSLEPDYDQDDATHVLDGGTVAGDLTETWSLTGEFLQDYTADSLVLWCAEHSGEELPFTFRPRTDQPLQATGVLTVRAVPFGGDVKKRNTSEFEFTVTGVPAINAGGLTGD